MFEHRYFPSSLLKKWFNRYGGLSYSVLGYSELGAEIIGVRLGDGPMKVLIWSQMHGNESTATRGLLKWLETHSDYWKRQEHITLLVIPQLNPDGANAYTRENGKGVDLNRDALNQSQVEMKLFRQVIATYKPDFAFNLHDQRTRFTVGRTAKEAALSFLSAAANPERTITSTRLKSMQVIVEMSEALGDFKPYLGRYDDSFNENCTGDFLQARNIPTVLVEAGQLGNDYSRSVVVDKVALSLEVGLQSLIRSTSDQVESIVQRYEAIPENTSYGYDELIIVAPGTQFWVRYIEEFKDGRVCYMPEFYPFDVAESCLSMSRFEYRFDSHSTEERAHVALRAEQYNSLRNS